MAKLEIKDVEALLQYKILMIQGIKIMLVNPWGSLFWLYSLSWAYNKDSVTLSF